MERIELAPYFERLISSHDYGYPKESPAFWDALQADIGFDYYGRKPFVLAATLIFTLASLACAVADDMLLLVIGRASAHGD